jgi:Tfp pilus assembly protein PilF
VVVGAERQATRRKRPTDLTAYELYLRGFDEMRRGTRENTEEAIRLFTQAVEKDSNLARAWTALATAHDYSVAFGADLHAAEAKAKEAAERAVAIDPSDADAHRALAEFSARWAILRARRRNSKPRYALIRVMRPFWPTTRVGRARSATRNGVPRLLIERSG